MKNLAIIILSQLLCFQAFAWRESNGGHGVTAEATNMANTFMIEMWKVPALRTFYVPSEYIIIPDYKLLLRGESVDAYTYKDSELGKSLIFIDVDKWNARSPEQKKLLIIHELTHVMSFTDHDYKFSMYALDKIEKYKRLENKHPNAEYPIDREIVVNLEACKVNSFILAYLLIGNLNHTVEENGKSILQLVEQSKCDNIKNFAPLKDAMLAAKKLN